MLESIATYKETVKVDTGGQEPVGLARVPEPVQVARAELLQELMAAGIEVTKVSKLRRWLDYCCACGQALEGRWHSAGG